MQKLKYLAVAALTAACSFGAAATMGLASTKQGARHTTVRVGDSVTFPDTDVACTLVRHNSQDPITGKDSGPALYCDRASFKQNHPSRYVIMTFNDFFLTDESGISLLYRVSRKW